MNRPIKFRQYYEGDDDSAPEWNYFELGRGNPVIDGGWQDPQQSTGLTDKNGVEIFEGDILRHDLWKIPVKVYWEYGGFMAQSVTGELGRKSYTDGSLYDMQLPKCKVIGNIYENPGLLKGASNV